MAGLIACDGCGRKVVAEVIKSAGGKSVCPPCYEAAKKLVEEKRRKAAEEKKVAVSQAKIDAAKVKALTKLSERGINVEDVIEKPVILPPSDIIPAVKKRKSDRAGGEVAEMLGSAGGACLMARIAAVVLMAMAGLYAVAGVLTLLGKAAELGAGLTAMAGAGLAALVASLVVPGLFLWFLGSWIKRFSELFAKSQPQQES
jgi:hypothetical protein